MWNEEWKRGDYPRRPPAFCPEIVTRGEPPEPCPPEPIVTRTFRPLDIDDGTFFGASTIVAGWAADGFFFNTWSIVSRSTCPECCRAETSFGHSSISNWASTPLRPTTVGTEMQTSCRP